MGDSTVNLSSINFSLSAFTVPKTCRPWATPAPAMRLECAWRCSPSAGREIAEILLGGCGGFGVWSWMIHSCRDPRFGTQCRSPDS